MNKIIKSFGIVIFTTMLVFVLISCKEPDSPDLIINIAAIRGITAPAVGGTPVTVITEIKQYTGTVVWSPLHETFQNSTAYFATITLNPKKGYTLKGVEADFFTVAGANTVSNDADSGVITAVFPITAGTIANPSPIDIPIEDITPITGENQKTTISPTVQYTGTITWSPDDNPFDSSTVYTATITLTPRAGFTLTGVTDNLYKNMGADSTVSKDTNSNVIIVVFPKTFGPAVIDIQAIKGVTAPLIGGTPKKEILSTSQYSGTITWSPADSTFKPSTVYTATITLTPYYSFKFKGVEADFFTVAGADSVSNAANSGVVTAVFNATNFYSINGLASYFEAKPDNTATTPYVIKLNIDDTDNYWRGNLSSELKRMPTKYFYLDLSCSTITRIDNAFQVYTNLTGITIPDSVTSIGSSTFSGSTGLTDIIIPNSVTSIGNNAFSNCTGLTGITIPDSVTSIGDHVFYYCTGLTDITIPDSVTSIGDAVFYGCSSLTSVTIPNSVTSIGSSTFYICTSLTDITIGNGVTSIESNAFYYCTSLTNITIPDNVTSIGQGAFRNCTSLTNVTIGNGVTSIGDQAFYECTSLSSATIGNGVTSIGNQAFYGTTWLNNRPDGLVYVGKVAYRYKGTMPDNTSLVLLDGTTMIYYEVFTNCHGLKDITIPDSVISIWDDFSSCFNLTAINVNSGNTNYSSDQGVLYNKNKTQLIRCPLGKTGAVTIPNSVTSIEIQAFFECTRLTSVTIPNSVTSIGKGAFIWCTSLTDITIPDSVTSIGDNAFVRCYNLTSVIIGNGVTSIDGATFFNCTSLTSITIPNSITSIGIVDFGRCTNLTSVTFQGTITAGNFNSDAFGRLYSGVANDEYIGDLREKYLAGGIGTYTRASGSLTWTKSN